jgi:hypothetical protein
MVVIRRRRRRDTFADPAAADWIQQFLRLAARTVLADPPEDVRQRLIQRFEQRLQRPPVERVVGTLLSDGDLGPALAGARGGSLAGGLLKRHLTFTSPAADVAVDLYGDAASDVRICGQVLPAIPGPVWTEAGLEQPPRTVAASPVDEVGEFAFEPVPAAAYDLVLRAGALEILIPLAAEV